MNVLPVLFLGGTVVVPERLIRAWLDRGVMLLQGYGLSEAARWHCCLTPPAR